MKKITNLNIVPVSKVFENTRMMITLPISEKAMIAEMLEDYHRETDKSNFESCEATLQIDIFADGSKFFTFNVEKYYSDGSFDSSGLYLADLSPELEEYYYKMAICQLTENLKHFNNV